MADPDLQIRGGGGHLDPEIRGGPTSKIFFRPFGPHFDLKVRGAWAPRALPLDPPLERFVYLFVLTFAFLFVSLFV